MLPEAQQHACTQIKHKAASSPTSDVLSFLLEQTNYLQKPEWSSALLHPSDYTGVLAAEKRAPSQESHCRRVCAVAGDVCGSDMCVVVVVCVVVICVSQRSVCFSNLS